MGGSTPIAGSQKAAGGQGCLILVGSYGIQASLLTGVFYPTSGEHTVFHWIFMSFEPRTGLLSRPDMFWSELNVA